MTSYVCVCVGYVCKYTYMCNLTHISIYTPLVRNVLARRVLYYVTEAVSSVHCTTVHKLQLAALKLRKSFTFHHYRFDTSYIV